MRTLGPHSVSSLLKGFLDILFALNALFLLFLGVLALWGAVAMAQPVAGTADLALVRRRSPAESPPRPAPPPPCCCWRSICWACWAS